MVQLYEQYQYSRTPSTHLDIISGNAADDATAKPSSVCLVRVNMMLSCKDSESEYMHTVVAVVLVVRVHSVLAS